MTNRSEKHKTPFGEAYAQQRNRLFFMVQDTGFTLVELVLAAAILAFTITGLIQVFVQSRAISEMSRNQLSALLAVETQIERIQEYDYDSTLNDYSSSGTIGNTFSVSDISGTGVISVGTWWFADGDVLLVNVTVSWINEFNRPDSVRLSTIKTRR